MDIAATVLVSQQGALKRRLDLIANNLANVSTTGFRREQPLFHELVVPGAGDDESAPGARVSFTADEGRMADPRAGAFQPTGRALDIAIEGAGYIPVQLADGSTAYTRSGQLKVLDDGRLAAAGGEPILGEGGQPIAIPRGSETEISIARNGEVQGPQGPLGRIALTDFADTSLLRQRGDGLLVADTPGTPLPPEAVQLRGGGLEASNVQPITETVDMVDVLRAYQASQRLSDSISDLRRNAISRLGRIGN